MDTYTTPIASLDSHVDHLEISDSELITVGRDQLIRVGPITNNYSLISFGGNPGIGNLAILGPFLWRLCVKVPRVVLRRGVW